MSQQTANRGISVLMAGTGINLALGVLYAWSIFKDKIAESIASGDPDGFNWDPATLNDPYAVACLSFAFGMIIAGKIQDAYGPRITALAAGILVGAGLILLSFTVNYYAWLVFFGLLAGLGIAFGYSAATPAAIKWFPPNKTGVIAGIVVAGFGLAPVYIAPLGKYLLNTYGINQTMLFFGVAFVIVVSILSRFLVNPPSGFKPEGFVDRRAKAGTGAEARTKFQEVNLAPSQILRTGNFWLLWLLYFVGAGAGLMVIGSVSGMAKSSMGENAFLAVVLLALGNAGGRVIAGSLCDGMGPKKTMAFVFMFQAILMFLAVPFVASEDASAFMLVIIAALIGFNYGANLSIFPAFAKDLWGVKHFGVNYGIIFTAWGVGGFVLSKVSQGLVIASGTYNSSFITAGVLLLVAAGLSFIVKDKAHEQREQSRA